MKYNLHFIYPYNLPVLSGRSCMGVVFILKCVQDDWEVEENCFLLHQELYYALYCKNWLGFSKSLKFKFDMLTVLFKFCDASVEHNILKMF